MQPTGIAIGAIVLAACSVAERGAIPDPPASSAAPASAPRAVVAVSASATSERADSVPAIARGPCPADMVLAGSFCVDRHEAHLRSVGADGALRVHPHQLRPEPGTRYVAVSESGVSPQAYISRVEAEAACAGAGKRLCSRSEWQLACRGTPHAARDGQLPCNSGKAHLLTRLFDQPFRYDEHFNNPDLNRIPGFLARTGEHAACRSDLGAVDMVGNLHEWVSDTATRALIVQLESDGVRRQWQPSAVGHGVFMGGFYSTSGEHGPGCLFTTVAHEPTYHDYSIGFRCCRAARAGG